MKFFKQKNVIKKRNLPTWEETVESMRDKGLNYIDGYKIIDVLYSTDNEHRFVILRVDDNYLTFSFESLQPYSEEEMMNFTDNEFAYWLPEDNGAKHIFDDIEILMRELMATPEYKTFFGNK